jgi:hypothetical protein
MKNLLITICASFLLLSCKDDKSLSKKIPGWYSFEQIIDKATISGNLTYYKNGALKQTAIIKGNGNQNIGFSDITLSITGTWKVEKGYLKEDIIDIKTAPQSFGDALLAKYKKESQGSPGDKIINVNKNELKVKTSKGETIIYKRIQQ